LLPKWRGAAPIQRSIMNLDEETGISIMKIVSKLDAGPVMMKSKINLSKDDNYESVNKALSILGAKMIVESLKLIEQNKSKFIEQDENLASYAQKINKSESKINWNEKAKKIIAKINAFYPFPGSWFKHNGSRVKITKAQERRLKGKPGEILKENFTIACAENSIEILELQKEGKKKMKTSEYLKGNKLEIGSNVGKNL
jgi:methionyl-tRNA formyltransferase